MRSGAWSSDAWYRQARSRPCRAAAKRFTGICADAHAKRCGSANGTFHLGKGTLDVRQVEAAAAHRTDDTRRRVFSRITERSSRIPVWFLGILIVVLRKEDLLGCRVVERRQRRGLEQTLLITMFKFLVQSVHLGTLVRDKGAVQLLCPRLLHLTLQLLKVILPCLAPCFGIKAVS